MKYIIIITLFLFGCSYEKKESTYVSNISNSKRQKEVAREFLVDIGGEEVTISNGIKGFYFNPKNFQQNEITAYKKWRPLFAKPKICNLAEMFQIDYQGVSLLELFSLPKTHTVKKDSVAILCLPSFSVPIELDPKWILTYLSKGVHVLAINFEHGEKTTPAEWETTCKDAISAVNWLEKHVSSKIFVSGKSHGAIAASYVAANQKDISLILETPLILHPLTNKEWLKSVTGKILVIQTLNAQTILQFPKHARLMTVLGSHFGPYFGDLYPTWYENEKDQLKLLKFLME